MKTSIRTECHINPQTNIEEANYLEIKTIVVPTIHI